MLKSLCVGSRLNEQTDLMHGDQSVRLCEGGHRQPHPGQERLHGGTDLSQEADGRSKRRCMNQGHTAHVPLALRLYRRSQDLGASAIVADGQGGWKPGLSLSCRLDDIEAIRYCS